MGHEVVAAHTVSPGGKRRKGSGGPIRRRRETEPLAEMLHESSY